MTDVTVAGTGSDTAAAEPVRVEFSVGEDLAAPLTWAQHVMWGPMQWFGKEANQFNIGRAALLAEPAPQPRLFAALRELIERHQTLRTRYAEREGEPTQLVMASGSYQITMIESADDPEPAAEALAARLAETAFDHEAEWPLRVGCVVDPGRGVTAIALVGSHLAFDFWAFSTVADQLLDALAGDGEQTPPAPTPLSADDWQPLDQAAYENSPDGVRHGQLAVRYWQQALSTVPASMFDFPAAPTGEFPIERHVLESTAATAAAAAVAARTRTSFSTVLLCLAGLVLTAYNGHDTGVLKLIAGNRLDRRNRELIALNAQNALLTFPVEDVDLLTAVSRLYRPAFEAYRRGRYDPRVLEPAIEETARGRGVSFDLSGYFNNGHRGSDWPSADPQLDPASLDRLRRDSRYSQEEPLSKSDMKYYATASTPGGGLCRLTLMVDTAYLPPPLGETLLRGIESLLCDAVFEEVRVSEIASRLGIAPARRGPGWVRTPGGWVGLDGVAGVVREAAGGVETAAFAAEPSSATDVREVTAYVAGGPFPIDALHERVLDALPGKPGVAAPSEYVICDSAPPPGSGLDAWRERTVVARGSGRPA